MVVNAKRVQRLMHEDNLIAMRRKPFAPPTSDSRHGFLIVPNLLRGLVPSGPDQSLTSLMRDVPAQAGNAANRSPSQARQTAVSSNTNSGSAIPMCVPQMAGALPSGRRPGSCRIEGPRIGVGFRQPISLSTELDPELRAFLVC